MTRPFWFALGWVCVGLGTLGIFLPLMPTVVFLIVAAYAFSRSSPRMHNWLINHRFLGPPLRDWQERGAISARSKAVAAVAIAGSLLLSYHLGVRGWILLVEVLVLLAVVTFIVSRPTA